MFKNATMFGILSILVLISFALAQGDKRPDARPFFAGTKPLEEYTPGVDYVPGEVVVVIPFSSKLGGAAQKPEEVRQELARLTNNIRLVTDPVRLATTTNNAKVCGGWLVRFRVDPNTPLTLTQLTTLQGSLAGGDLGDFTEAPNDVHGRPPGNTTPTPVPAPVAARAHAVARQELRATVAVIDSGVSPGLLGVNSINQMKVRNGVVNLGGLNDNYIHLNPITNQILSVGHGTQVAGLIAGQPTRSPGSGLAQGADVLSLQPCEANRLCQGVNVLASICYAASSANPFGGAADVINLSLGSFMGSRTIENAVLDARDAGSVVVMSAGNSRNPEWAVPSNDLPFASADERQAFIEQRINNFMNEPVYPAAFSGGADSVADGLISVASVDHDDAFNPSSIGTSWFSTWNPAVDFVVTGENLEMHGPNGGLVYSEGTSFAAPIVAGLAAQTKAANPTLNPAQIEQDLRDNAPGEILTLDCGATCGNLTAPTAMDRKKFTF